MMLDGGGTYWIRGTYGASWRRLALLLSLDSPLAFGIDPHALALFGHGKTTKVIVLRADYGSREATIPFRLSRVILDILDISDSLELIYEDKETVQTASGCYESRSLSSLKFTSSDDSSVHAEGSKGRGVFSSGKKEGFGNVAIYVLQ
ncbi:unnamed protein product [Ilex paraguariensis]|uniref:Uncharacterized protein n=1 Tax=Ilex paraguariensis TaxID=185542 RepID=A0ABC8UR00_9AQUA